VPEKVPLSLRVRSLILAPNNPVLTDDSALAFIKQADQMMIKLLFFILTASNVPLRWHTTCICSLCCLSALTALYMHSPSDFPSQPEHPPARPPFKQQPFRRNEARRSQTKERTRSNTPSNEEPSSYSIQSKALNDLPALRAGRRRRVSGGNRGAGTARVRGERGAMVQTG
jgi:hypothetical protein